MQQKLHLVLREVDHVPAVTDQPLWLLSRPAFSIEYNFGQSIYEKATSNDSSSNLNESILFLSDQKILHHQLRLKSTSYMIKLKLFELTSFLSAMGFMLGRAEIDQIEI